ncbi:hypothetical protein G6F42_029089 [Rhizopus arrhizus]|nr:hypothetical protein G6F42_029089 [Rhizopus arrhizus]
MQKNRNVLEQEKKDPENLRQQEQQPEPATGSQQQERQHQREEQQQQQPEPTKQKPAESSTPTLPTNDTWKSKAGPYSNHFQSLSTSL